MLTAVFYRTEAGSEPVREWLRALPKEERKIIGGDIDFTAQGWPVGKPLVDGLGQGLWEVRSRLRNRIKKTQQTPHSELALARKRMKHYRNGK